MKTNRDEILRNCLGVFASMNYERASITLLSHACGLSRMGIHHYYPNKQALFTAVADHYVFEAQDPGLKFPDRPETFAQFIGRYVEGIRRTMQELTELCRDRADGDLTPNFRYFNFLFQVRQYYPAARERFAALHGSIYRHWLQAVIRGGESGELRAEIDPERTAALFRQIHLGMSFETALLDGLDADRLEAQFRTLYALLRAR